ncbi:MAG: hypothetical protein HQL69_15840 [Magnetococcales bacterium]|nr:hypothetical protein [Magnetococcales bacterium]
MNRYFQLTILIVSAMLLGGCAANVDTPWDRKALDPGQITTMKPLEIPPTFDELPEVVNRDAKVKEEKVEEIEEVDSSDIPSWITAKEPKDPDLVPELSMEQKLSNNGDSSTPGDQDEKLPSWLEPEKKSE